MTNSSLTQEMRFRLKSSREYSQASFAWITSLLLTALLLFNSYDWSGQTFKPFLLTILGIYVFFTLVQSVITLRIRKDLIRTGTISTLTRRLAWVQLLAIISGNIFIVTALSSDSKSQECGVHLCGIYAVNPAVRHRCIRVKCFQTLCG